MTVSLLRHESGPRWECSICPGECEHILLAAVRMTLESWGSEVEMPEEAEYFID